MGISGKCDFEDTCVMYDNILDKYKIYAYGNEIIPLEMKSKKDLVAYYPYIVSLMVHDGIHLSKQSFIDSEEQENMQWRLDKLIKYYKKCKRKKIEFDKNEALKEICWINVDEPEPYEIELVDRVAEYGVNATIDNLHDSMHDMMRNEWYALMLDNGRDEDRAYRWVYGWQRWLSRMAEMVE